MYKQGDIIIVFFPYSDDFKKSKLRPAIVVSNELSNGLDNDLIICPITTRLRESPFSFSLSNEDLLQPLPNEREVRCNKFATIRSSLILDRISALKADKVAKLAEVLKSAF